MFKLFIIIFFFFYINEFIFIYDIIICVLKKKKRQKYCKLLEKIYKPYKHIQYDHFSIKLINFNYWDNHLQNPRYYLPKIWDYGPLPNINILNSKILNILNNLQNNKHILLNELQNNINLSIKIPGKIHNLKWKEIILHDAGSWNNNIHKFPNTYNLLKSFPNLDKNINTMIISFSILPPGTIIYPHYGPSNTRLRIHIPLQIPKKKKNCFIVIADIKKYWNKNENFLIDDSYIHYVINNTNETRIIMLIDIFKPCISNNYIKLLNFFNNLYP